MSLISAHANAKYNVSGIAFSNARFKLALLYVLAILATCALAMSWNTPAWASEWSSSTAGDWEADGDWNSWKGAGSWAQGKCKCKGKFGKAKGKSGKNKSGKDKTEDAYAPRPRLKFADTFVVKALRPYPDESGSFIN